METPRDTAGSNRLNARMIGALAILAVALIFVFSNTRSASLRFLGLHWSMPGWIWFIFLLLAGVVIGSLWPWLTLKQRLNRN